MRAWVRRGTARRRVVQGAVVLALVGQAVVTASNVPVGAVPAPIAAGSTERDSLFSGFSVNELPDDTTSYDLSADGRYVVFATTSHADGTCSFTPQLTCVDDRDTNDVSDVFVRDRFTGRTDLISIGPVAVAGALSCTPTSVNFPNVGLDTSSSPEDVTCTNDGPGPVTVTGTSSPTNYIISDECTTVTLLAGDSCTVTVTYSPSGSLGNADSTLDISHTGSNQSPITIGLHVIAGLTCAPATHDFGFVIVGTNPNPSFTSTCTAEGPAGARLTVQDVVPVECNGGTTPCDQDDGDGQGGFFTSGGSCAINTVLTVPNSCTVNVQFRPQQLRTYSLTYGVLYTSNPPDGVHQFRSDIQVTGQGVSPPPAIRGGSAPMRFERFWDALRCLGPCHALSGKVTDRPTYTPSRFFGPFGAMTPALPAVPPNDDDVTCDAPTGFECLAVGGGSPSISDDGRYIAFDSNSNELSGDGTTDVFVADRCAGEPAANCPDPGVFPSTDPADAGGVLPTIRQASLHYDFEGSYNEDVEASAFSPSISGDGSQVAFFCSRQCVPDPPEFISSDASSALLAIRNFDTNNDGVRNDASTAFVLADTDGDGAITNTPKGVAGAQGVREYAQADTTAPPAMSGDGKHVAFGQWIDDCFDCSGFELEAIAVYDRDLNGDGLMGDRDIDCLNPFFGDSCESDTDPTLGPPDGVADENGGNGGANDTRTVFVSVNERFDDGEVVHWSSTVGPDPVNQELNGTDGYEPTINRDGSVVAWTFCTESCDRSVILAAAAGDPADVDIAAFPALPHQVVVAVRGTNGEASRAIYASVDDSADCPTLNGSRCPGGGFTFSSSDHGSFQPSLSGNGRYLAFSSNAPTIIGARVCDPYDTSCSPVLPNQIVDVDLGPATAGYPTIFDGLVIVSVGPGQGAGPSGGCVGADEFGDGASFSPVLTADGASVGFLSDAGNLLGYADNGDGGCDTRDQNARRDAFLRNLDPSLHVDPTTLVFPVTQVNTSSPTLSTRVIDDGFGPLLLPPGLEASIIGPNADDFAIVGDECTQQAAALVPLAGLNDFCAVQVVFQPNGAGVLSATLLLAEPGRGAASAGVSTQAFPSEGITVPLRGSARAVPVKPRVPLLSINPLSLRFGDSLPGQLTPSQTITAAATGNTAITISALEFTGANPGDFVVTGGSCSTLPVVIAVGTSCTINVAAITTQPGTRTAILRITDDALGGPHLVSLVASSPEPRLTFNPTVARRGTTSKLIGTQWPVNATINIIGASSSLHCDTSVTTDATGAFTVDCLVLPKQEAIPRTVTATATNGSTASANILITAGSAQGGLDFLYRH